MSTDTKHTRTALTSTMESTRKGCFMATTTRRGVDVAESLALIEKGQQMAGHFPSDRALERARRILTGELSVEDSERELEDTLRAIAKRDHGA